MDATTPNTFVDRGGELALRDFSAMCQQAKRVARRSLTAAQRSPIAQRCHCGFMKIPSC
jgi:hypothetical protein